MRLHWEVVVVVVGEVATHKKKNGEQSATSTVQREGVGKEGGKVGAAESNTAPPGKCM